MISFDLGSSGASKDPKQSQVLLPTCVRCMLHVAAQCIAASASLLVLHLPLARLNLPYVGRIAPKPLLAAAMRALQDSWARRHPSPDHCIGSLTRPACWLQPAESLSTLQYFPCLSALVPFATRRGQSDRSGAGPDLLGTSVKE